MSTTWKIVRVFISSTFRDMQAERDHLVRFVFPRLREELLKRRIHFIDVDLRWGVTSEQDALTICQEIIDECHPRFLCMLGGRYGWVPPGKTRSITASEVHYGVLDRTLTDRGFAYFYLRDDAATAAMVETTPGEFREPQGGDNQNKLTELKQAIIAAGLNPFTYQAQWDNESRRLTGLKEFGDWVYNDLLNSMESDPELRDRFVTDTGAQIDEFAEENAALEAFVEERSERFVLGSRETVLEELLAHTSTTGGNGYVCLIGAPGSGKSALLAYLSRHSIRNDEPSILLIRHFVGASPGSTDVRHTLRRLCHELKASCPDITAYTPDDPEELRVAFLDFMRQACAQKRVVILLDAVNQFDSASHSVGLNWLPEDLPANARVILSALDGSALEELRRRLRKPREIELKPLTADDREAIVEQFRQRYRKAFEAEQRAALLAKADADTPLYLLAALEELRTLSTYEEISQRIVELPSTIQELFAWILKRLEDDQGFRDVVGQPVGRELVSRFSALLGASRYGLSQRELGDLLGGDNPQGNIAALLHLLRPYLMRRGELLDYYHGQFRAAAKKAWLNTEAQRQSAHVELASYFHRQDNFLESLEDQRAHIRRLPPTPRLANRRKTEELVYQRLNVMRSARTNVQAFAHACEALEELLTDLVFLEAKTEAGLVFELALDFSAAVDAIPASRPHRRILCLLQEALRRDIQFINRHPTTLFQCMWNTCWWYDCPEADGHYEAPEAGWPPEGPPWKRPSLRLHVLVESWRDRKSLLTPDFAWVRSLRPPQSHLGAGQRSVCTGHTREVRALSYSPRLGCLVSAGGDGTVRVWDIKSGREISCFRDHHAMCLTFSPAEQNVIGGYGETIYVWDGHNGSKLRSMEGHTGHVNCLAPFPADNYVVSAADDGTIRVWNIGTGHEIACLRGHEGSVKSVAVSPDGQYLVSGSTDLTIRFWHTDGRGEAHCCRGHEAPLVTSLLGVESVSFSPDGLCAASGGIDDKIRIWDVASGRQIACLEGHEACVFCLTFSPDGRRLFSGSWDGTVRVWDMPNKCQVACLRGHEGRVISVAYTAQDNLVMSASSDGTIRMWNADGGDPVARLRNHEHLVTNISFTKDGKHIKSESHTNFGWETRIWDVDTGICTEGDWIPENNLHNAAPSERDVHRYVSGPLETSLQLAKDRLTVAWWPVSFQVGEFDPLGTRLAGARGKHIDILSLEEGDAPRSPETH